ncbi:unnamed protein product [Arctia plantaginis]|uniref:Uncharacterized protein n=1 Tax=Arctia plantaginis TaxID=874455 RepID=A0A8S0ZPI4_ARCPL|nr:unnamed protein product [Arctia plantaginis]
MKCQPRIRHIPAIQTVILDFDENFNASLKTCMIKYANSINSVVLINNNYTSPYATLERCKTDDHPTIVILTKQITTALLDTPSVRGILRSQRSVLTIAVTDEKKFTCRNDSMTTSDFLYLEAFMNELWHKYKIAHVSISFPLSCYGKLAVYGNKRNTNEGVYDRTIMLIRTDDDEKLQEIFGQKRIMLTEGYPLKANIFERIPTSTRLYCDKLHYYNNKINLSITDGYCGLDAFVMHTIVEHFKFKLELGHINHIYTTLVRYKTINKLAELFKSDIVLYVTPSIYEIMKQIYNKENDDERNFINRMIKIPKKGFSLDILLKKPKSALAGRQKDMHIEIFTNYITGESKQPLIHIMNECLRTYYLSYIGRPGFPFVEELQRLMLRVREAGLDEIYYEWTCGMYRVPSNLPEIRSEPRLFHSITLQQLQVAFGLLSLGHIISLYIFIIEVLKGGGNR